MGAYFRNIYRALKKVCIGMRVTLKYAYSKPITVQYPDMAPVLQKRFRGFHYFEIEKCIACDMCAKACPVDCIYIESVGKGKQAIMTRFDIDYSKCLFCALCVPPCPSECIVLGEAYSLPGHTRDDMIVKFHEGGFPIQVKSEHSVGMIQEFKDEGLFEQKRKEREDYGIPTLEKQD